MISISNLLLLLALFVEVHDTKLASRFIPDLSINGITQETLSFHTRPSLSKSVYTFEPQDHYTSIPTLACSHDSLNNQTFKKILYAKLYHPSTGPEETLMTSSYPHITLHNGFTSDRKAKEMKR